MKRNTILKYIGDFLIIASLLFFVIIYGPIIKMYFFPKEINSVQKEKGFTVTVPKINAQASIVQQVNPWDQLVYDAALQKGVAQAKGSSYPNQKGTIFLFAHSSTWPWEETNTNTPFLRLGELTKNDPIYITWNNRIYLYKVTDKKEVWPNEITYLTNLKPTQLILQTCTPIGTSLKRLLIFAKLSQIS